MQHCKTPLLSHPVGIKLEIKEHGKVLTLHIPLGKGLYWAQFRTVLIQLSEGNETFLFCSMIGGNTML
jgi:hypothetical protein